MKVYKHKLKSLMSFTATWTGGTNFAVVKMMLVIFLTISATFDLHTTHNQCRLCGSKKEKDKKKQTILL